jgi:imidazolonepropionase-like amidohydrolase
VTAVRDASDNRGVGLALSRESRSSGEKGPEDVLPRVDSPGPAIHHRGSYGGFIGEAIEAQPSLEACVESRIRAGARRLKLMVSGVIDFREGRVTTPPQMSAEEVRTLVRAARERRRPVFAHASGPEGVETALAGDIESVEHGYFVTSDQLARMRDRRIAWVPTFAPVQAQLDHADVLGWDGPVIAHLQRILDGHARALRHAAEIGVPVLAGSDAGSFGVPHGRGLLLELALMEKAGMRTLDVLAAASGVSATHLGLGERLGAVLPGRRPRFILTGGRPLETVTALGREEVVIFDGRVLHPPKTAPSSPPSPRRQARGEPCP